MSLDRPLLRRRRVFASKLETTTGTPIVLATADAKFNAYDRELNQEVNMTEREAQGNLGMLGDIAGARMGTLPVTTFLHGNGASGLPLWATTLLASSGYVAATATYSPTSEPTATTTNGIWEDGNFRQIAGAMADFVMTFATGQPVRCDWTLTGKLLEPTSVALVNRTAIGVTEPVFTAGTLTIGGTPYKTSELVINAGNNVVMREDANADDDASRDDGTGFHAATITSRNIEITCDVESKVNSTKNWTQDQLDGDTAALSVVLGHDANNIITVSAPALYLKNVQPAQDRNGIMVDQLTFGCAVDSVGGNDELTFAFS